MQAKESITEDQVRRLVLATLHTPLGYETPRELAEAIIAATRLGAARKTKVKRALRSTGSKNR